MNLERLFFALLFALAATSLVLGVRFFRRPRPRSRARAVVLVTCVTGFFAMTWARCVEPYWIETTTTHIPWTGPPLRIVLLADVHAGRALAAEIREAVERTNAARPDVVVLAGDYVSGFDAPADKLAILDGLRALTPRVGTFAVLGNHDTEESMWDVPRALAITRHLEGLGIVVLRNASRELVPGATIVGLGDWDRNDSDGAKAFADVPAGPTLLVAHNPASVKASNSGRFDVALAAHTHGGQACVPFIRYCPLAHEAARPYVAGLYALPNGASLYVTRGIGESGVKARFACRPEISILDLSN